MKYGLNKYYINYEQLDEKKLSITELIKKIMIKLTEISDAELIKIT